MTFAVGSFVLLLAIVFLLHSSIAPATKAATAAAAAAALDDQPLSASPTAPQISSPMLNRPGLSFKPELVSRVQNSAQARLAQQNHHSSLKIRQQIVHKDRNNAKHRLKRRLDNQSKAKIRSKVVPSSVIVPSAKQSEDQRVVPDKGEKAEVHQQGEEQKLQQSERKQKILPVPTEEKNLPIPDTGEKAEMQEGKEQKLQQSERKQEILPVPTEGKNLPTTSINLSVAMENNDSTSVPIVQSPPTSEELVLVEQPQMTSVAISKSGNAPSATVLSTTMDLANIKAAMLKIIKTPSKLKKILGKLIGKKRRNTLTPKDLKKLVKLCTKKVYKKVPTLELLNEVWNVAAAGGSELSESTLEKWLF